MDQGFDDISGIDHHQEGLVWEVFCRQVPVLPEDHGFLFLARSIDEGVPSINLIDNCDIDHSHEHNPEVEDVVEEHVVDYSLVLGGKDSLVDVLESKHPGHVHQVSNYHCVVLEVVDVRRPVFKVLLITIVHWHSEEQGLSFGGKGSVDEISVLLQVETLVDLVNKNVVHQDGVYKEAEGESDVAGLGGVAPDLELEPMRSKLTNFFFLCEPEFLLHVVAAVIIIEQQVVHSRGRHDGA